MSFDLYFASVGNLQADNLFNKLGCNRLFSWLEASSLKRWISISDNPNSKLFIDSGAYSAHSKGKIINIDTYIDYLNSNDDKINVMAELDKIPGELNKVKTLEQRKEAPQISWENYLYIKDKIISRDKLLPIFHQGEDFKWLKNMLEYKHSDGTYIQYIGISPQNDVSASQKEPFIQKCFDIIKASSNPSVKTHAFGMTSLDILEKYPFTSADSTSWKLCAAFGSIMTDYGVVLVSSEQSHNANHIDNMPKEAREKIISNIESFGLSYENVRSLNNDRTLYNIYYLKEWADNYEYKPIKVHKKSLF